MVNLKTMNLLDKPISPDDLMNAVMDDQDRLSIDFSSQSSSDALEQQQDFRRSAPF